MRLSTDSAEFLNVVRQLRTWDPQFRHLALYAATFWDDDRLGGAKTDDPPRAPPRRVLSWR
jgi:hypothetical protein